MTIEDFLKKLFNLSSKPLSIILKIGPGFVGKSSQVFVVFVIGLIIISIFGAEVFYVSLFALLGFCALMISQVVVVHRQPILSAFEGSKAEALIREQAARNEKTIDGPSSSSANKPPPQLLTNRNQDGITDQSTI